ncbi:MAG TPA: hypothetical protein VNU21_02115 [Usitatibacter sp.]|nr:hypothetical protein [Usitatibacter sp.]
MGSAALNRCKAAHFVAALLLGSAFPARAERGLVTDAVTGSPVSGVFIVTSWQGSTVQPAHPGPTGCYHVELTRSNEQGQYEVDAISGNVDPLVIDRRRDVVLYKPGYEYLYLDPFVERASMRPFTGSFEQRFQQYESVWARGCPDARRTLRPLLEAISAEAKSLARLPTQREKAAYFELQLDIDSIGRDAAYKKYDDLMRRIKSGGQE